MVVHCFDQARNLPFIGWRNADKTRNDVAKPRGSRFLGPKQEYHARLHKSLICSVYALGTTFQGSRCSCLHGSRSRMVPLAPLRVIWKREFARIRFLRRVNLCAVVIDCQQRSQHDIMHSRGLVQRFRQGIERDSGA